MELEAYLGPVGALAITSAMIIFLSPLARAAGLVDVPNARKHHKGEIPVIGGLAIFAAVFTAMAVLGLVFPDKRLAPNSGAFYVAGLLLIITGAIDDYLDLSPWKKLAAQMMAALIMVYGAGIVLSDLGNLGLTGGLVSLGILAVPFTVFATISVINAVNMSDGLDGLAGSLSLVGFGGFIIASLVFGSGKDVELLALLAAAVAGFLVFNYRYPGRPMLVFLGDSGSMLLGFALAWFAIDMTQGENRVLAPAAALWFVLVPLFDAACITTRRLLKRRPPFGADREHLHHIFLLAGFTVTETVSILTVIASIGVAVGLAVTFFQVPDIIVFGTFAVLGLMYLWMIVHSWSVMRFLKRSINRRTMMQDRRSGRDRRQNDNVAYMGPERRSGRDRRRESRRKEDSETTDSPSTDYSLPRRAAGR